MNKIRQHYHQKKVPKVPFISLESSKPLILGRAPACLDFRGFSLSEAPSSLRVPTGTFLLVFLTLPFKPTVTTKAILQQIHRKVEMKN